MCDPRKSEDKFTLFPDGFYMMNTVGDPKAARIKIPKNDTECYIGTVDYTGCSFGKRITEIINSVTNKVVKQEFKDILDKMMNTPYMHIDKDVIQNLITIYTSNDHLESNVNKCIEFIKKARSHPRIEEREFLATAPCRLADFDILDDMFDKTLHSSQVNHSDTHCYSIFFSKLINSINKYFSSILVKSFFSIIKIFLPSPKEK